MKLMWGARMIGHGFLIGSSPSKVLFYDGSLPMISSGWVGVYNGYLIFAYRLLNMV